jgi:hypothetical protein
MRMIVEVKTGKKLFYFDAQEKAILKSFSQFYQLKICFLLSLCLVISPFG